MGDDANDRVGSIQRLPECIKGIIPVGNAREGFCLVTADEQKLLRALNEGFQDKKIARDFELPLHVVKYRLRTLYDKMGVDNRTQAALKARELIV